MIPTTHCPTGRSGLAVGAQRCFQRLRNASLPELERALDARLPKELLSSTDEGLNSRQRIYTLRLTFQCFVWQMLKPKTSLREVVRHVQALFASQGGRKVKGGTSAYSEARSRLPRRRLEKAALHLAKGADAKAGPSPFLQGRPIIAVDSTGLQLSDTPKNQKKYPQPSHQRPGCGFPAVKLLACFSVRSGAITQVVMSPRQPHELRLFRQLWSRLIRGTILLGDRIFSDFATLADYTRFGLDGLARLNSNRRVDFRRGERLGPNDAIFTWQKPDSRPPYLTLRQWAKVPDEIRVRILRFQVAKKGYRTTSITLVTTLLDSKDYPFQELVDVYARRWRLELCFLDLKTKMGMEQIRGRTPRMVQKEVGAYLVAHNLIRCLMAEASARYEVDLERLSFKGSIDSLRQFSKVMAQASGRRRQDQLWNDLLETIASDLVRLRPGRREPRAIKRRPKPFPRLIVARDQFKDPIRYHRWLKQQQNNKKSKN